MRLSALLSCLQPCDDLAVLIMFDGGSLADLWDGRITLCGPGSSHLLSKILSWGMGSIVARDDSCSRIMWSKPRKPVSPALFAETKVRVAEFPLN